MAKRSSRSKRRPRASTAEKTDAPQPVKADLASEYQYVIEDLRRIGLIALILIGGLVVLSLFL